MISTVAKISIQLLGRPQAVVEGTSVRLRSIRSWGVLASIALSTRGISREDLALRFWPNQLEPRVHLRQSISSIRTVFGAESIRANGDMLHWQPSLPIEIDLMEWFDLLKALPTNIDSMEIVLENSGRIFLEGLDQEADSDGWLEGIRTSLSRSEAHILNEYSLVLERKSSYRGSYQALARSLELWPQNSCAWERMFHLGGLAGIDQAFRTGASNSDLDEFVAHINSLAIQDLVPAPSEAKAFRTSFAIKRSKLGPESNASLVRASIFPQCFSAEEAFKIARIPEESINEWKRGQLACFSNGRIHLAKPIREILISELPQDEFDRLSRRHAKYFCKKLSMWEHGSAEVTQNEANLSFALETLTKGIPTVESLQFWQLLSEVGLEHVRQPFEQWLLDVAAQHELSADLKKGTLVSASLIAIDQGKPCYALELLYSYVFDVAKNGGDFEDIYKDFAFAYHHSGDRNNALTFVNRAICWAEKQGFQLELASAYRLKSEILRENLDFHGALNSAMAAQSALLKMSVPSSLYEASIQFDLALCYELMEEIPAAQSHLKQSLELRMECHDDHGVADCLKALSRNYLIGNQVAEAWAAISFAISIYEKLEKPASKAAAMLEMGDVHASRGRPDLAKACYEQGKDFWQNIPRASWIDRFEIRLAKLRASQVECEYATV